MKLSFRYASAICLFGMLFAFILAPKLTHAATISIPANYLTINKGLMGWWTFDGKSMASNVADSSGNSNNGFLVGFTSTSTAVVPGKIGQALSFDGASRYVRTLYTVNPYPISGCAWFKYSSNGSTYQTIIDNSNTAFQLSVTDDVGNQDYLLLYNNNGSISTAVDSIRADKWNYVCATVDSSNNAVVYINGTQSASGNISSATPSGVLCIGAGTCGSGQFFNGAIDDVRIYNRLLSPSEVTLLYNSSATKYAVIPVDPLRSSLMGWWTFDGKDMASNVADVSGNGRNGRLVTVTSTTTAPGVIGQAYVSPRSLSTNAYIDTGSNFISTNPMTICLWANMTTNTGNFLYNGQTIMATNSSNRFGLTRDNTVTGAVSATNAVVLGKWQHYCATSNTTTNFINLYVNAVLTGGANQVSGSPGAGATNVRLLGEGAGSTVDGAVDDIRIYNRELSAKEIAQVYNSGVSKVAVASANQNTLGSGLVLWWTFDGKDMASNVADKSGNGNNGFLNGFTSTSSAVAPGKIGQAILFPGVINRAVTRNTSVLGTGDLTISMWINARSSGVSGQGVLVYGDNTNNFDCQVDSGTGNSYMCSNNNTTYARAVSGLITFGKWQHFVAERNSSGQFTLYLNGVRVGSANQAGGTMAVNSIFRIGSTAVGSIGFDGAFDDVRVYNRLLSTTEINQLYAMGL